MDNKIAKLHSNFSIKEMNDKLIELIEKSATNLRPWVELENTNDETSDKIIHQFQMNTENESMPDYSDDETIIFNNVVHKEKYILSLFEDKAPVLRYFSQDFENIFFSGENADKENIKNRLIRQSSDEYNDFYDICDIISIEDIEPDFE